MWHGGLLIASNVLLPLLAHSSNSGLNLFCLFSCWWHNFFFFVWGWLSFFGFLFLSWRFFSDLVTTILLLLFNLVKCRFVVNYLWALQCPFLEAEAAALDLGLLKWGYPVVETAHNRHVAQHSLLPNSLVILLSKVFSRLLDTYKGGAGVVFKNEYSFKVMLLILPFLTRSPIWDSCTSCSSSSRPVDTTRARSSSTSVSMLTMPNRMHTRPSAEISVCL